MTHDDLTELEATLNTLRAAQTAVDDLADRMARKGEHGKADRLRVHGAWRVERAARDVEAAFS